MDCFPERQIFPGHCIRDHRSKKGRGNGSQHRSRRGVLKSDQEPVIVQDHSEIVQGEYSGPEKYPASHIVRPLVKSAGKYENKRIERDEGKYRQKDIVDVIKPVKLMKFPFYRGYCVHLSTILYPNISWI